MRRLRAQSTRRDVVLEEPTKDSTLTKKPRLEPCPEVFENPKPTRNVELTRKPRAKSTPRPLETTQLSLNFEKGHPSLHKNTVEAITNNNDVETRSANSEPFDKDQKIENIPTQKRLEYIEIEFKGRKHQIPPFFQNKWTVKNEDRTLLNDTLIEFYMCEYMWNEVYDDSDRERFHVFHSFFFSKLKLRFSNYFKSGPPRRSELAEHYNRIFQRVSPRSILKKEVLVIPIHLEKPKHWFLVLVHNPSAAIRRFTVLSQAERAVHKNSLTKQVNDYAGFEEAGECRVVIMDSLCSSEKYKEQIELAHTHAFDYISLWLQMAAAANKEELMYSRVRKIVCEELPQQKNSVDCGIFMMFFAEYFTRHNTEWTKYPTESISYLLMPEECAETLETAEPRMRLDRLVQRLKFEKTSI